MISQVKPLPVGIAYGYQFTSLLMLPGKQEAWSKEGLGSAPGKPGGSAGSWLQAGLAPAVRQPFGVEDLSFCLSVQINEFLKIKNECYVFSDSFSMMR